MRVMRVAALAATIGVCLSACGGSGAPPKVGPEQRPVAAAPKTVEPQPASAAPSAAPPSFVYAPTGVRDPFQPFIKLAEPEKIKKKAGDPKAMLARAPLERFAFEELRLVGILWADAGHASALVEDPHGKGYSVRVGAVLGDRGGKIVRIQPDRVVVEEKYRDLFGQEKVNVMNMPLHRSEGEVAR